MQIISGILDWKSVSIAKQTSLEFTKPYSSSKNIFYGSVTWISPSRFTLSFIVPREPLMHSSFRCWKSIIPPPYNENMEWWYSIKFALSELTLAHLFFLVCWVSSMLFLKGIIKIPTFFCKQYYNMFVIFNRLLLLKGKRFIEQNMKQFKLDQPLYSYSSSIVCSMTGHS